jgi:hypothetical protein
MTSLIGIPASRAGVKSCPGFENRSGSEAPDAVGDYLPRVEGRQNLALQLFLNFKRPPGKPMSTFDSSLRFISSLEKVLAHLRHIFANLRTCTVGLVNVLSISGTMGGRFIRQHNSELQHEQSQLT